MNKLPCIFAIFFMFIFSLSFISSNFVCGIVNNSKEFSSFWSNVIIYPEGNLSNISECKINPENKFCCDLEELSLYKTNVGDKIFAEVFDEESGFVAGPVSLALTGESYDVFPEMSIQKTILINSPKEKIFINQSSILINVSLATNYNNLKYVLNSSNLSFQKEVCTNCNDFVFPVNLSKGKNEITLTAYGSREISEKIIIYNLDYINFKMNISCNRCKLKGNVFSVPSGENISFYSFFNASHNISGDFLFYFPSDWMLFNSSDSEDFSLTHKVLGSNVTDKKEFIVKYTLQSPKTLIKKDYLFYQKIENNGAFINVSVFKSKLIPFHNLKPFEKDYFNETLSQKGSPNEPIILNSKEDYLKLAAIFPKVDILNSYSNLKFDTTKLGKKQYIFTILTNIPQKNIDRIFLLFKVENGKSIEVYFNKNKIPLEFYEQDSNYAYYSASVHEKGPFQVKIF